MSRALDVYLNKEFVGTLIQDDSGNLEFSYHESYLQKKSLSISLSLPLSENVYKGEKVKAFFSGLLPDEEVRNRLAKNLGVTAKNPFALLEIIGGECAGALALYPQGQTPYEETHNIEALDDKRLSEVLDLIRRRPMLAGDGGYRLSLAGAQDKLAVIVQDNQIALSTGGQPTTHILKPLIRDVKDSVHNELFCMKLAKLIGIDVPNVELRYAGDQPYYLIQRYDRIVDGTGNVIRIHQEDFCQALAVPPEIKYEREGGPSIDRCQDLIKNYALRPALDQIRFLDVIIFNYLIGNSDAHGKNFSFLYKESKPELAPAYDLLSTAIYPELADKMAMKIGGKYKPNDVYIRHFYKVIPDTQVARNAFDKRIHEIINKIHDASSQLKKELEEQNIYSDVFDEFIHVIQERSRQFM